MMNRSWLLVPVLGILYFNDVSAGELYPHGNAQHMYLGLSGAFVDVDGDYVVSGSMLSGSRSIDNTLMGVIVGYQLHENFAFEARGYGNVSDETIDGVSYSVDSHFSVLARGILPLNEYFRPYALLGYGKSMGSIGEISEDDNDIIYGLGVSISNGNRVQLELEWMRIYDESFSVGDVNYGLQGDSINLNLVYHFPSP
ncbi:outer membrane beta-barrel protein [Shewanella sp. JBTF-M18]|uniref:Outer membrane beta-barrel protein n=1 Tax=Shewanella insulae TaxID=2681496 RepID=A0A6L7I3C7_9GAMM|nr:outer membrane beta-barrel protein [Shewanella insulae]MXR71022.1 outer membrane beta-barrel protein [Shewanella insulae]